MKLILVLTLLSSQAMAEVECTGYDEELIGSNCAISLYKIPHCPGDIQAAVCIQDNGETSNDLNKCDGHVQEALCLTKAEVIK